MNLLPTIVLKNDNDSNVGEIDKLTHHNVQLNCIFLSFESSSWNLFTFSIITVRTKKVAKLPVQISDILVNTFKCFVESG